MLVLHSNFSGLEFWSVKRTSIYENSKLNDIWKLKFRGEISNNWPTDILETNLYNTL